MNTVTYIITVRNDYSEKHYNDIQYYSETHYSETHYSDIQYYSETHYSDIQY